jgi:Copper amine oxidase N-terminal domain
LLSAEDVIVINALLPRRQVALAATLAVALAFVAPMPAPAQSVTVIVGGQPLYLNPGPIERSGRVFVPLRAIFERLGASVVYQSGTINATKGSITVSLQIGSTNATINGQPQILDVAPFIVGASTYVPLRFVAQSLGATVNYNDSTQVVSITGGGGGYHPPVPVRPPAPPVPNPPAVSPVRLRAQQPQPGANVANRFVAIAAEFTYRVQPPSVRVWLDGNDVTYRAGVSPTAFSYKPPAPLGFGSHTVRTAGADSSGARFDRAWSFNTVGAPPPPPANPVQLRAQQPAPGANILNRFAVISAQFTIPVAPGSVRVWLDGADRTSQSGISASAFSFKPPAPLNFGSHTMRVTGRGQNGVNFDRAWSFTVARATPVSVNLTIANPGPNAVVGRTFDLNGSTIANGRIRVTAGATPAFTGQFTGSTVAGPRGNFGLTVTLKPLMGQQTVSVKIVATDPVSSKTTQTTLQLRLR